MAYENSSLTLLIGVVDTELCVALANFACVRGLPARIGRTSSDFGTPIESVLIAEEGRVYTMSADWVGRILGELRVLGGAEDAELDGRAVTFHGDSVVLPLLTELDQLLRRTLRAQRTSASLRIHIPPVLLDEASRQVFVNGSLVPLRRAEFNVLRHLMQHTGRVVSSQELMDSVLLTHGSGGSARTHIYELRRKLAQSSGTQLIETLRGGGYRYGSAAVLSGVVPEGSRAF